MKAGWKNVKLGDLCEIERGGSPRPIDAYLTDSEEGINWIKISDATASGKYIYRTEQKIKPEGVKRSRMVYDGDFILSNSMSFGRPYIMRTSGCIHDGWLVLRQPKVNPDYLYLALGSDLIYQQFDRLASGSTVRNLNIGLARTVEIPVPSETEQQRIVAILDEAFAGIATARAAAEQNRQNARALFESHLQSVFSQRGEGWVERTLGQLCQIKTGKKDVNQGNPEGTYPFFTCAATHTYSDSYSFDTEAILIAGNGNVGQVSYYSGKFEAYQRTYVLFDFKEVSAAYLYRVLDKRLSAIVGRQKLGNTMPYIKIGMLTGFDVPVPSTADQIRITAELDALATETQRLEALYQRKLEALDELKQSLLHQAFSGEL